MLWSSSADNNLSFFLLSLVLSHLKKNFKEKNILEIVSKAFQMNQ